MKTTSTFALLCCVVALALLFSVQPAHAGFTWLEVEGENTDGSYEPYWGDMPNGVDAWMDVYEHYDDEVGSSYELLVRGGTDEDPILSISKDVFNGSSFTWLGYEVDLAGATFVGGSASSDTFTLLNETATELDFGLPAPLLPGQTVNISFDILILSIGDFDFTLTQSPIIPEPATVTILGIAGLVMFAARRRRSL